MELRRDMKVRFKFNGAKTKFRVMKEEDTITSNCYCAYVPYAKNYDDVLRYYSEHSITNAILIRSKLVGKKVNIKRLYLERI